MIEETRGNILAVDAEALVNTVNCVGVMGKGIALQFKQAFPDNFRAYERACRHGELRLGSVFVFETGSLTNPRYILNFPTKDHWRSRSRLDEIEAGLQDLVEVIQRLGIQSVAMPPLGCGNGGLDWVDVRPRIEAAFADLPDVRVLLFAPRGAPAAEAMPVRTSRPEMTAARAVLLKLMEQYSELDYRHTLLEIQKAAYFLQEAGEPLQLQFKPERYGPYAHNLNHVLQRLEGHYTRGYGDSQKPDTEIWLLEGATRHADAYLVTDDAARAHLERVGALILGFETPYGMELLATVHWVATRNEPPASSPDEATQIIHAWNARKRRLFQPEHVAIAWQRLTEGGWLNVTHPHPAMA